MSQKDSIKEWLLQGHPINPHSALIRFGCMRLASRIDELRHEGLTIVTTYVKREGKRWASYSMAKREFPVVP